jgi:CheY-like chemotaxis protein
MLQKILDFFKKTSPFKTLAGKTILVVDDNEVERTFISRTLQKQGCRVLTAVDGQAGLVAAQNERPDLIILDFVMPNLNGRDTCQRLKANSETKRIPVVFLTGSVAAANVVECYDVGADYYLNKPIGADMLIKQIDMTFQEQDVSSPL